MAEEEKQENESKKPKQESKLKILLTAIIPMIFMFLGFFVVTKFINPHFKFSGSGQIGQSASADINNSENTKVKEEKKSKKGKKEPTMLQIDPVLANPLGTEGRRFAKVGITVEVQADKNTLKEFENNKSKIQHLLIITLSSKDVETLASPEGKLQLREEIRKAIIDGLGLPEDEVSGVYFREFIVQ
ncbi:MAG: flagellar basal body-associated FliL family protein [Candidatus Poribacteria bacterium]